MNELKCRDIGSLPFFWPLHEQPVFLRSNLFRYESYPVTERIARKGFYIPSGSGLEEDDVVKVAEVVKEDLKYFIN